MDTLGRSKKIRGIETKVVKYKQEFTPFKRKVMDENFDRFRSNFVTTYKEVADKFGGGYAPINDLREAMKEKFPKERFDESLNKMHGANQIVLHAGIDDNLANGIQTPRGLRSMAVLDDKHRNRISKDLKCK